MQKLIFFKKAGLFVTMLFFLSCGTKREQIQYTQISVLLDVTDEHLQNVNFAEENLPRLMKLLKLDRQKGGFSGGEVKLSIINEVSDSKSKTIQIGKGEPGLLGENPLTRKDEVQRFYNTLEHELAEISQTSNWGANSSKIYQKVARETIKMKRTGADNRYMIIYSDMLENSNLFSFYHTNWKKNVEKLLETPENTLAKFAENGPEMPDLSEFNIFIVAKRTPENDEKINLSEQFWTSIFEYLGANVYFGPELNF